MELHFLYGVRRIHGFCNGYQGFIPKYKRPVLELTPQSVSQINEHGGTILGTSRGEQDPVEIVDCLERMGVNVLFVIGGDGTLRGAQTICKEIEARGAKIAVVGIPKTIDNDIMFIDQSFGFQTAFSMAADVIRAAHVEAKASPNGDRAGEADGPALGLHRLLRRAGAERRQLRAHPRGAVRPRRRRRAAGAAPAAGPVVRARGRRGRRGRRAGTDRRAQRRHRRVRQRQAQRHRRVPEAPDHRPTSRRRGWS